MKKKLFLLLLIVALAAFVFAGCTPPAEGEGEGEGEGEIEGVIVDIDGAVEIDGKTYVSGKSHGITITFPAPVANASATLSDCSGDYSKAPTIVLWPNADKTVWTGQVSFTCSPCYTGDCWDYSGCCASYISVEAGECEGNVCISVPVIVDCLPPVIGPVEICLENCECEGCQLVFKGKKITVGDCADAKGYCYDACSGFGGWSLALYKKNPFDKCCETPCYEPFFTCEGDCQVDCITDICFDEESWYGKTIYVLITAFDNVGNRIRWLASITFDSYNADGECDHITVEELRPGSDALEKFCTDTPDFEVCNETKFNLIKLGEEECPLN